MTKAEHNEQIANTIYQQIGGDKFMYITGSKHPVIIEKGLRISLCKNGTSANRLDIILNEGADLYDMKFYKLSVRKSDSHINTKVIASHKGVFFDQLTDIFQQVTGLAVAVPVIHIGGNND